MPTNEAFPLGRSSGASRAASSAIYGQMFDKARKK
jgi:hypothetical protein